MNSRIFGVVALVSAASWAADPLPPRLYELTIETGMPNLEENLRYATRREQRCLGQAQLAQAFPVLRHESLQDCRLEGERRVGDTLLYELRCDGGHGTSGSARWLQDGERLRGVLDVKLGGKNMTFYERIGARPVGPCEAP